MPAKDPAAAVAESGNKRVEDLINFQIELFKYLQEVNQDWLAHMQSEAGMASEFASKLAAARSMPEAAAAYQQWASRRIELLAEDGKRLFADTQKLTEIVARAFVNGQTGV